MISRPANLPVLPLSLTLLQAGQPSYPSPPPSLTLSDDLQAELNGAGCVSPSQPQVGTAHHRVEVSGKNALTTRYLHQGRVHSQSNFYLYVLLIEQLLLIDSTYCRVLYRGGDPGISPLDFFCHLDIIICECGKNESPTHHLPPSPGKHSCIAYTLWPSVIKLRLCRA